MQPTLNGAPQSQPRRNPKRSTPRLRSPRENWNPFTRDEPIGVELAIYVIDIDGVDSVEQNFSGSVYYEAHWNSPALRHEGPGPLTRQTADIWTPRLTIINQQQVWPAFPERVEISPDGDVALRQKVWGSFSQPLDLRDFPLDRQTLTIHVVAAALLESEAVISPLKEDGETDSGIAEQLPLPDFRVVSWKAQPQAYVPFEGEEGIAGFLMEIDVQRQANYYVWKIIFPLCLIVVMSWIPRWMDPKHVNTNIGVATTSVLTLVAYLFAIAHLLPRVAYFTRLDKFILLSTLMVFIGLLQTVATTRATSDAVLVARVDWWSRIVYPALLLAVLVISFGL